MNAKYELELTRKDLSFAEEQFRETNNQQWADTARLARENVALLERCIREGKALHCEDCGDEFASDDPGEFDLCRECEDEGGFCPDCEMPLMDGCNCE